MQGNLMEGERAERFCLAAEPSEKGMQKSSVGKE